MRTEQWIKKLGGHAGEQYVTLRIWITTGSKTGTFYGNSCHDSCMEIETLEPVSSGRAEGGKAHAKWRYLFGLRRVQKSASTN